MVEKLGVLNAERDPDDIYEQVTQIVEEVRQDLYDELSAANRSSR